MTLALMITGIANGQQKEKNKSQDVIIKKNGKSDEKMTIVIDGENITINGKPITEYNGDDIVIRQKALEEAMVPLAKAMPRVRIRTAPGMAGEDFDFDFKFDENIAREFEREFEKGFRIESDRKPQAILGVVTEKTEKGLKLTDISGGSAAEKAGLKEGDVLTKFAGTPVNDPEKLRELVRSRKPQEEVEISYIKAGEKKERKAKVKLGSYTPEFNVFSTSPGYPIAPRAPRPPRAPMPPMPPMHGEIYIEAPEVPGHPDFEFSQPNRNGERYFIDGFAYGGKPQLGVRIQDTDDSSGVKVLDVHDGSLAATAGVKESDVIVNIDGKRVRDTDDAREALQGAREKSSYPLILNRGGQVMNIEIKVPRKLKKTDL
jgi:serine protease Do